MKLQKVSGAALLKMAPSEIVGQKKSTAASKQAVREIINWCGGVLPIPIVINQATGNIISGQELYRAIQSMSVGELKGIKEIPLIFIDQSDPQTERDLITTLPDTAGRWRINDYVDMYAANKVGDYGKIQKLCDEKPRIFKNLLGQRRCMIAAMALKPGESSQSIQKKLKDGTFTAKIGEIRTAKSTADEVLALANALDLQKDGDFNSNNIVSMLSELNRVRTKKGHTNADRIAEIQLQSQQLKDKHRHAWNRSCWHQMFDDVETQLP